MNLNFQSLLTCTLCAAVLDVEEILRTRYDTPALLLPTLLLTNKQHNSHSFSGKVVPSPFAGNTKDKKARRKEYTVICWDCTKLLLLCVTFVISCLVGWYPSSSSEMLNNPRAINKSYLTSKARLSPAVEEGWWDYAFCIPSTEETSKPLGAFHIKLQ